jgi:hypothetical protein
MAVSTESVALIAAAGTAVGALIGSATGGVMDFWLDRARERRRAKVGARMVRAELAMAASRLKAIEDEKKWWNFYEFPMPAWSVYEDALTARLKPDKLEPVTQAVLGLRVVTDAARAAGRHPTLPYQPYEDSATVRRVREEATAGYNALASLAGERKVSGLLHDAEAREQ